MNLEGLALLVQMVPDVFVEWLDPLDGADHAMLRWALVMTVAWWLWLALASIVRSIGWTLWQRLRGRRWVIRGRPPWLPGVVACELGSAVLPIVGLWWVHQRGVLSEQWFATAIFLQLLAIGGRSGRVDAVWYEPRRGLVVVRRSELPAQVVELAVRAELVLTDQEPPAVRALLHTVLGAKRAADFRARLQRRLQAAPPRTPVG